MSTLESQKRYRTRQVAGTARSTLNAVFLDRPGCAGSQEITGGISHTFQNLMSASTSRTPVVQTRTESQTPFMATRNDLGPLSAVVVRPLAGRL
jgi:hypothetical protein